MIDLWVENLHWLGEENPEADLCAHGSVYLRIGNRLLSDKSSGDWTVSAAAYYLLQTVSDDYILSPDIQLIPCCGIPIGISETDPTEPIICGCPNGVNWTIKHDGYLIKHCFDDGEIVETDLNEWRMSVVKFSDEVMKFFENSKQKQGNDNEEYTAFQLFWKKWKDIRAKAE